MSAPQFYQVSYVTHVTTSRFLSAAFLRRAYLEKRPVTLNFGHFLERAFHLALCCHSFFEEEWRVLEGMSRDLPSLSSHLLFRYFCTAWIATADISTLREGGCCFVPSQGSIQRGSDKVHRPCFDCTVAKALGWDSALFPSSAATRCSI